MSQTKALRGLKITNADEGRVEALFATFNVKDHDDDVTLPGAFQDGEKVRISVYNHGSWGPGLLPVGKGIVRVTGDGPVLDGQFFLNTTAGRDTFETVKQMGDLQEWSYGYDVLDSERGTKDGERVRFLKKMKVHEVSPVLLGAGIETRTLGVKRRGKQLDSELRERLQAAGVDALGSENMLVWLVDFDIDEGTAIFEVIVTSDEGGVTDEDCIRVPFLRGMNGDVVIGDGREEVERNSEWVAAPPDGKDADPDGVKRESVRACTAGIAILNGARDISDEDRKSAYDQLARLLKGAGVDDAPPLKARPDGDIKLTDHLETVCADVKTVTTRLSEVTAQRAEKGKGLGDESRQAAEDLADEVEKAAEQLREVLASAATTKSAPSGLTLEDETRLAENRLRLSA